MKCGQSAVESWSRGLGIYVVAGRFPPGTEPGLWESRGLARTAGQPS